MKKELMTVSMMTGLALGPSVGPCETKDVPAVIGRFLRYVAFDTQSSDNSAARPSTPGQRVLSRALADELRAMGAKDVYLSDGAHVYATLPATADCADKPALGFLAHVDTAPDASGKGVRPSVVTYAGGTLPLGTSGRELSPEVFPELKGLEGQRLVVTDGTTLLGGDDKLGVALCMSLAERLLAPDAPPHREIRIAFTPDEEIGRGMDGFDPKRFGATLAYTVDGGDLRDIKTANFNAAYAVFTVKGVSVHPGDAKGKMVSALKVAGEILAALPPDESPECTAGREGFFHPERLTGTVGEARLELLVRDHDAGAFASRKERLRKIAADVAARHPKAAVEVRIDDQYANMGDVIAKAPQLVENAVAAVRAVGLAARTSAVRGGTDGAALAKMGIPCPNLGTGGRNFHGECEYAIVDEVVKAEQVLLYLATH